MLKDYNGNVVHILFVPPRGSDSAKPKIIGLLMGLIELKSTRIEDCIVEGDSVVVIGWGLGKGNGSWKLAQLVYEVKELAILLGIFLLLTFHRSKICWLISLPTGRLGCHPCLVEV